MLKIVLSLLALLSGSLASLLLLMPWHKILCAYRIKLAKSSRDKTIRTYKKHLKLMTNPLKVGVDEYSTSKSWGASKGALASAKILDETNQVDLKAMGLERFSIRNNEGYLDEGLIEENYQNKISELEQAKSYETRDLRPLCGKLILFALVCGIIVIFL